MIYQSGTLGSAAVTNDDLSAELAVGTSINEFVFAGGRFHVIQDVMVTQIGGHFLGRLDGTSFFGAIVRLDDACDFPDSADLSSTDVLGATALAFPNPSAEVMGDLSVALEPGWYAVVFGSGLFGTNGRGGAIRNGQDIGGPSYIMWQPSIPGSGWSDLSSYFSNHRFVVEGYVIPEPATAPLAILAALALACRRRPRAFA